MSVRDIYRKCVNEIHVHAPELLIAGGVAGFIGSGIWACFQTVKAVEAKKRYREVKEGLKVINTAVSKDGIKVEAKAANEDEIDLARRNLVFTYIRLYGPVAMLMVFSGCAVFKGHGILKERAVALAAAYTTLDGSFRVYRSNVIEKYGEDVDRDMRLGLKTEKIETEEKTEDGKTRKMKVSAKVCGPNLSGYARYFAYGESLAAERNADYNETFLVAQQTTANKMLKIRGYLFLNDVYEMLGYERSIAGQAVGWVFDPDSDHSGDNYVDFRIEEVYRKRDDGELERVFVIDPNVDGNIMDHLISRGLITD